MPSCISAALLACALAVGGCSAGKTAETSAPSPSNEATPSAATDLELVQTGSARVTTGSDQAEGADTLAIPEATPEH